MEQQACAGFHRHRDALGMGFLQQLLRRHDTGDDMPEEAFLRVAPQAVGILLRPGERGFRRAQLEAVTGFLRLRLFRRIQDVPLRRNFDAFLQRQIARDQVLQENHAARSVGKDICSLFQ